MGTAIRINVSDASHPDCMGKRRPNSNVLLTGTQTVLFSLWLVAGPAKRIRQSWLAKAVRFNWLLRDFENAPSSKQSGLVVTRLKQNQRLTIRRGN